MKVWNFAGVNEIKMGQDTIKEVWLGSDLVWRIPPNPPGPDSWVDAAGTPHDFTFTWSWPDHNTNQMSMTVTDGSDTVVAAEAVHYGTATDGSGELFMIRTHDLQNVFWVMVDGFERGWLWRQKGFPIRWKGTALNAVTLTNVQL